MTAGPTSDINNNLEALYLAIGENIRRLRGRMSQRDLAKKSKVSRATIQKSEAGGSISLEKLHQIAKTLDIPIADFFVTEEMRGEVSYMHVMLMGKLAESFGMKPPKKK